MDSQEPTIEEKLVPFVEGALAEADRREVLQALPNSPALNQEVRQLRETILMLRTQAARGMTYQSPVEAPAEQVVDFALQSEQWSRPSSRQFQLHMLESSSLAEELSILKELEQDLQQRVEPSKAIPEMPAALRAAIQEAYGRPAAEPAWKKTLAAMVAWMAGMNLKVAAAAVASCVVIAGGIGMGRYAHQQMQVPATGGKVAVITPSEATPSSTPAGLAAAAPVGQVALLKDKVLPEDLPGLSRRLWQKQVSHSYRDGQIYVAQADYEKAWGALQLNPEKIAMAQPLKTGSVPVEDKKTNLLDGVIGMVPESAPRPEDKGKASRPVSEAKKTDLVEPSPAAAVAVHLPAPPEASAGQPGDDANYNIAPEPDRRQVGGSARSPVVPLEREPVVATRRQDQPSDHAAQPEQRQAAQRPAPVPAAIPIQESYRPSQMAKAEPPTAQRSAPIARPITSEPQVQAEKVASPPSKMKTVFQGNRKRAADTVPGYTSPSKNEEYIAPAVQPIQKPAYAAPKSPIPAPVNPYLANKESKPDLKTDEEDPVPQPASVSVAVSPAQVSTEPKDEAPRATAAVSHPEGAASTLASNAGPRPDTKATGGEGAVQTSPAANQRGVAASRVPRDGALAKQQSDEAFEVQGNAPFEVAMLPVAKKLVEEIVGEAKVQMERKEDGHLLVTIRPARSLSAQEVDKLRKVVREKLELEDEDTVVIRQP
ncbi:hypothetical protein IV102_35805 [bacterium]|nr:hypothetical protein [bacterium]